MTRIALVVTVSLALLLVANPVSAHHKDGHQNGQSRGGDAHSNKVKSEANKHAEQQGGPHQEHPGLHLGQVVHPGLTKGQADDLAERFRTCATADNVEDMRLGQIKRLAHAAGLSTDELRDLLNEDGVPGKGLGRLWRDGLEGDQADDLAEALREGLEAGDIRTLKLGRLVQAAHACGITTHELNDILSES